MEKRLFKSLVLGAIVLTVLAGFRWVILKQSGITEARVNEMADLRDPSPFRVALTGYLDKIHLNLLAHMKSPEAAQLEEIATGQREFERSLHDFEVQNPRLFPSAARDEILQSYKIMRESVQVSIEASQQRIADQTEWRTNFDRFLNLIQMRLRPLSKKDREGAVVRNDSLLNLENQWRSWQQALALYWTDPKPAALRAVQDAEERSEAFLNVYEQVAVLTVERKLIRELRGLRQNNIRLGRQIGIAQKLESERRKQVEEAKKQALSRLTKMLPPLRPEELESKKVDLMRSIRLRTYAMGAFAFLGMLVLISGVIGIYRVWRAPVAGDGLFRPKPAPVEAFIEMNSKGNISHWSEGAERFYGYHAREIEGQSIAMLFASENEIQHLYRELQRGHQSGLDAVHKDKSGETFPVRIDFQPIKTSSGNPAIRLVCKPR